MGKLENRRNSILKILEKTQLATVADLSEELDVTMETIRKDLLVLEDENKIVRIHGGAALANQEQDFIPYGIRKNINSEEKRRVAKKALELICEGDSILLENSTTTAALCQQLLEQPEILRTLTVITNSFYMVQCLKAGELCRRLLFLGGWVSSSESSTLGAVTTDMMKEIRVNKAFISGAALNDRLELTAYYERDMQFQQEAIRQSDEAVLLLDSGKYPKSGGMSVAGLEAFGALVTDLSFTESQKKELAERGIRLLQA